MKSSNLVVEYKGRGCTLNPLLIARQNLSSEDVELLKKLHLSRLKVEDAMRGAPNVYELKGLYNLWFELQHSLQDAWKFKRDDNFIKFWDVPRCTCPKIDNEDSWPHGYYVYNCDCPVHGS